MSRYFFICIAFISVHLSAQVKSDIYPIAFYNLENLFDTNRDNNIQDEDFTPQGKYQWTEDKYNKKLNNLADVKKYSKKKAELTMELQKWMKQQNDTGADKDRPRAPKNKQKKAANV